MKPRLTSNVKEKVEYERLKLEEQISMLEKVIEEGIKQTTELQEIHHSEVEDLHKQVRLTNTSLVDGYLALPCGNYLFRLRLSLLSNCGQ